MCLLVVVVVDLLPHTSVLVSSDILPLVSRLTHPHCCVMLRRSSVGERERVIAISTAAIDNSTVCAAKRIDRQTVIFGDSPIDSGPDEAFLPNYKTSVMKSNRKYSQLGTLC